MATAVARAEAPAAILADGAGFVFVDLETTGLRSRNDRIIEVAGLRVATGGEVVGAFHELVACDFPVPSFITAITGITDDMLIGKPPIEAVLPRFFDFLSDLPVVAFNAPFDMGFLRVGAERMGRQLRNPSLCALQLARRKLPDLLSHRLEAVADHLGFDIEQSHRALDDCELGLKVFITLMQR
jgi:DNA polymerase III epsilon subunit family exonuclease